MNLITFLTAGILFLPQFQALALPHIGHASLNKGSHSHILLRRASGGGFKKISGLDDFDRPTIAGGSRSRNRSGSRNRGNDDLITSGNPRYPTYNTNLLSPGASGPTSPRARVNAGGSSGTDKERLIAKGEKLEAELNARSTKPTGDSSDVESLTDPHRKFTLTISRQLESQDDVLAKIITQLDGLPPNFGRYRDMEVRTTGPVGTPAPYKGQVSAEEGVLIVKTADKSLDYTPPTITLRDGTEVKIQPLKEHEALNGVWVKDCAYDLNRIKDLKHFQVSNTPNVEARTVIPSMLGDRRLKMDGTIYTFRRGGSESEQKMYLACLGSQPGSIIAEMLTARSWLYHFKRPESVSVSWNVDTQNLAMSFKLS
ncbi:hypothetical protein ABW19_dt0201320 [Dactylella cylindrospora]|nr:hypothetical protein ABW19_dt0201320 [Dactylella cylindrospora]